MKEHNKEHESNSCSVEVVENGYVVKYNSNYIVKTSVFKDFTARSMLWGFSVGLWASVLWVWKK